MFSLNIHFHPAPFFVGWFTGGKKKLQKLQGLYQRLIENRMEDGILLSELPNEFKKKRKSKKKRRRRVNFLLTFNSAKVSEGRLPSVEGNSLTDPITASGTREGEGAVVKSDKE